MFKITLVFYQNPEALPELKHWEKENNGKFYKEESVGGRIKYEIIEKSEKIFCFDINNFSIEHDIDSNLLHSSYKYNKTLIFGKVNHFQLEKIQQILLKYE